MSMVPELEVVKYFLKLPLWARALCCLAILMLTAVFSVPWIKSQGIGSYYVIIAAVAILSIILLFVSPQTEIRSKSEKETEKDIQRSPVNEINEQTPSLQKEMPVESKKKTGPATGNSTVKQTEGHIAQDKQKTQRENALHKLTHD